MQRSIGARAAMHATRRGPQDSARDLGSWLPWSQDCRREKMAQHRDRPVNMWSTSSLLPLLVVFFAVFEFCSQGAWSGR